MSSHANLFKLLNNIYMQGSRVGIFSHNFNFNAFGVM